MNATTTPDDVLAFWFGAPPHTERGEWFRKDAAFDAAIRERFGDALARGLAGAFGEWCGEPRGALARVVLLDQFTRNAFRDTPRAFAGDARALATADDAIRRGFDASLDRYERWFLYIPYEHSEDLAMQRRALELFGALARDEGLDGPLRYAKRHAEIIERFGRFPHRNAILGRESTPEEIAFLREPGSSF
ncbi:MAG TPA: DUF924 family protein [Casimicrobiaceae bacterium]|nr:DUF924 family protein [Casimicrobiaceae bacterium]